MKHIICAFVLFAIFVGCTKENPTPTNPSNNLTTFSTKSMSPLGLKVAEKIDGIVICTVDEDVLRAAVTDYYQGQYSNQLKVVEHNEGTLTNFFTMEGRVRVNKRWYRYAFELVPNVLPDGDIEFFLPVAGTEQHLYGPGKGVSKFILTSPSTGYGSSPNSLYGSSTSTVNTDSFGTNKLINLILSLLI